MNEPLLWCSDYTSIIKEEEAVLSEWERLDSKIKQNPFESLNHCISQVSVQFKFPKSWHTV